MIGVERESRAAIVQVKTEAVDDDARSPYIGNALNPGDYVAFAIGGREVNCVADGGGRGAMSRLAMCFVQVDERGALFRVFLREEPLDRHVAEARIGDV